MDDGLPQEPIATFLVAWSSTGSPEISVTFWGQYHHRKWWWNSGWTSEFSFSQSPTIVFTFFRFNSRLFYPLIMVDDGCFNHPKVTCPGCWFFLAIFATRLSWQSGWTVENAMGRENSGRCGWEMLGMPFFLSPISSIFNHSSKSGLYIYIYYIYIYICTIYTQLKWNQSPWWFIVADPTFGFAKQMWGNPLYT